MTRFTIFDETSAPADSKPVLRSVKARLGFIPNIMGELAASPTALDAYATLSAIFGRSGLTELERQVVLLTADYENNCGYCMAADSTKALGVGLDREVLVAIREGRIIESDPRLEALHQFTRAMVRERVELVGGAVLVGDAAADVEVARGVEAIDRFARGRLVDDVEDHAVGQLLNEHLVAVVRHTRRQPVH